MFEQNSGVAEEIPISLQICLLGIKFETNNSAEQDAISLFIYLIRKSYKA